MSEMSGKKITESNPNGIEKLQDASQSHSEVFNERFDLDPMDDTDIEYELALNDTGFGKFNVHILLYCGLLYALAAISTTVLSFVLSAAVNELNLTSTNKGVLVSMPMVGMLFGSYFWGCLASTKGRWITILFSLLMNGVCGILSTLMPNLQSFCVVRFFNGFAVSGIMNICFPYLGEFVPIKHREKMLCWLEFFWVFGIIILPGIAYGLIPLKFHFKQSGFAFTSWKLYLIVCALPNFVLAIWLMYFPESPKFLVEHGEQDQALHILGRIFEVNTGRSAASYGISGIKGMSTVSYHKLRSHTYLTVKNLRLYNCEELMLLIKAAIRYTARLFYRDNVLRTLLLFGIQFGLTFSYYTLMLWFPELFNRYELYRQIKGHSNVSICEVSYELSQRKNEVSSLQAEKAIYGGVYQETLYLGLSCLPLSIIFPFIVHRVGSRLLLAIGLVLDSFAVFLILLAQNELHNLILSCITKLLASISISLLYGITVDLYPAKIRVLAAALGMTVGRLAALFGNLFFGFSIDKMCNLPFILFGVLLLISSVLALFLPKPDHSHNMNITINEEIEKQHYRFTDRV